MCTDKSLVLFAKENRRYNNAVDRAVSKNGGVCRYESVIARGPDADEESDDGEPSYDELKGDLHTIGWNNHQMSTVEEVDMNGDPVNADDDEGYEPDEEMRSAYVSFCMMSEREQERYIAQQKLYICALIGVSFHDWEPSDAFILEAIQDETPDDMLKEMAYAAYLATPLPPEGNPSDEYVGPGLGEEDDLIRVSQQSVEWGMPNIGRRNLCEGSELRVQRSRGTRSLRSPPRDCDGKVIGIPPMPGSSRSRRSQRTHESHCPKYGRQDERHQALRIEAKSERRFAALALAWVEDKVQDETNFTEAEMEVIDRSLRRADTGLDSWEMEFRMEDMLWEFHGEIPESMHGGFRHVNYLNDSPWDWDDGLDDPFYWDDGRDDTLWCDDPHETDFDDEGWPDADVRDDIFERYGETPFVLDLIHIGHQSGKRRTYHHREMMEKRPSQYFA